MTISDDDIALMLDDELLARRTKVMFLRNGGATWPQIAELVGVSTQTCRKDYSIVCRDINNEQPADVVARHRAVIFDIQRANYPAMMRGDKDAAVTILRALKREAMLLGLDQPVRILAAVSTEDFANEAARLIEHIQALDADTLKELTRGRTRRTTVIDVDEVPGAVVAAAPSESGQSATLAAGHETQGDQPMAEQPSGPGADPDPWSDDDWSNI